MTKTSQKEIVRILLEDYGYTFSEELDIPIARNTPSALFRLLCAALLFSTRISSRIAVRASQALTKRGWTTAQKIADSEWSERTRILNRSGYARYDGRGSTMLGETAQMLLDHYKGDLRNLREEANRKPDQERKLLKQFKGIGDVGVDIFFREVQVAWEELFPFADRKALNAAKNLGLKDDVMALANLVDKHDFSKFIAALVRVQLERKSEEILRKASFSR